MSAYAGAYLRFLNSQSTGCKKWILVAAAERPACFFIQGIWLCAFGSDGCRYAYHCCIHSQAVEVVGRSGRGGSGGRAVGAQGFIGNGSGSGGGSAGRAGLCWSSFNYCIIFIHGKKQWKKWAVGRWFWWARKASFESPTVPLLILRLFRWGWWLWWRAVSAVGLVEMETCSKLYDCSFQL